MYEFYDFIEFLDSSQVEDCLDYAAFKRITESIDINMSWREFMLKIRDAPELTYLIDNIIEQSLNDVKAEQFNFDRTERPIPWFDKTSHNFDSFIRLAHNKKGPGYICKLMYWSERTYYNERCGIQDKETWLHFCNEIISNKALCKTIRRALLHVLAEIDFDKYIPDTDALFTLFGRYKTYQPKGD